MFNKINLYVIKEFCKMFIYITLSTILLVFFIDFLEFYSKVEKYNIKILDAIRIVLYKTPEIIDTALYFIILLSSSFTLTKFSLTSELVAVNAHKKSLFSLIKTKTFFIFIFGILYITFINPFMMNLSKKSIELENFYTKKDRKYLSNKNGIWFKQNNIENNINIGEIIFKAEKFYDDKLEFENVDIIFTTDNHIFQKKIKSKSMIYDNDKFILNDNIVSKSWQNMEMMDQIIIPTKLTKKFLKQYIQNRYEDIDSISLKELNKLIVEFEMSNLDTTRFLIKKYTMILVPFMYVIMAIIPYGFLNINARKQDYILNIFKIILCGFAIFVLQNILIKLGSGGVINIFYSTITPFLIILLLTIVIVIKKIKLCNY